MKSLRAPGSRENPVYWRVGAPAEQKDPRVVSIDDKGKLFIIVNPQKEGMVFAVFSVAQTAVVAPKMHRGNSYETPASPG